MMTENILTMTPDEFAAADYPGESWQIRTASGKTVYVTEKVLTPEEFAQTFAA